MKNRKPNLYWEEKAIFLKGKVLWACTLDNRFQIEVNRIDAKNGELIIFDHDNNNKEIFSKFVTLSYGAIFGADVEDIKNWQQTIVQFIDNDFKNKRE